MTPTRQEQVPRPQTKTPTIEQLTEEVSNLRGFASLTAEMYGYRMGKRFKQEEMRDALKKDTKSINEKRKAIHDAIEDLIKKPNAENANTVVKTREATETLIKEVKPKRKPFEEVIKPLSKAVSIMDKVVIPDSLKELGYEVKPTFSLSDYVKKLVVEQEKAKASSV